MSHNKMFSTTHLHKITKMQKTEKQINRKTTNKQTASKWNEMNRKQQQPLSGHLLEQKFDSRVL